MAFDSLSDRLNKTIRNIAGKGKLTDDNMESMLKEVRLALLEADVNYKIVKDFLNDVREKSRGEDVINSVQPGEMLVKIVHDELVNLLGNEEAELHFKVLFRLSVRTFWSFLLCLIFPFCFISNLIIFI